MAEEANIRSVQAIYAAFGAQDIPALLGHLASDVVWIQQGPASIPFAGEKRGHEGVTAFFTGLCGAIDFTAFAPLRFVAQGDIVVVLGRYEGIVRTTGKSYESDWAMAWTFRDGLVTHFCQYADSSGLVSAMTAD